MQPTQGGSCTFVSPGTFSYDDPNTKGNAFRGTITVAGPTTAETLTAAAKPPTVIYAGKVTLSGVLSTLKVAENVDVLATACGQQAANKITTVQTTTGGAYVATVQPLQNTVYTTKVKSTSSPAVVVKVQPRLQLSRRRSTSVCPARGRRPELCRQVRNAPALQRRPRSLGERQASRAPGELDRRVPDRYLDVVLPLHRPGTTQDPGRHAATPGRRLLLAGTEQHDPELAAIAGAAARAVAPPHRWRISGRSHARSHRFFAWTADDPLRAPTGACGDADRRPTMHLRSACSAPSSTVESEGLDVTTKRPTGSASGSNGAV